MLKYLSLISLCAVVFIGGAVYGRHTAPMGQVVLRYGSVMKDLDTHHVTIVLHPDDSALLSNISTYN